jgi:5-methylcytosine-specific restriction protein A
MCVNPFGIPGHLVFSTDVDHIIPREAGGSDDDENLQGLCHACHSRKTAQEDGGFGHGGGRGVK